MGNKVETAIKEPLTESACRHYWIIESPDGSTSKGVCKFCGAESEFNNSLPDLWAGSDTLLPFDLFGPLDIEPVEESEDF